VGLATLSQGRRKRETRGRQECQDRCHAVLNLAGSARGCQVGGRVPRGASTAKPLSRKA
jgi:hypothetical protein